MSCFALSPNDQMLVSASRGLLMVLWDPENATPTRTWKSAHILPIEVMAFDSTSTLLASGGADGTVKIYDMVRLLEGCECDCFDCGDFISYIEDPVMTERN